MTFVAEFPQPKINDVRRFLRKIGAIPVGSGKGDHEKWRLPDGRIIHLNAAKGLRNELDFASLKELASALGISIVTLTDKIRNA